MTRVSFVLGFSLSLAWAASQAYGAPDAAEIMKKSSAASKVASSESEATFTLITASGEKRERRTKIKTKLSGNGEDNQQVTRFLSPPDVKGTSILLVEKTGGDDDLWIYLPALKKVRRLVSSNKKDSFVGTDFSYGDVIGHKASDWKHRWLRDEKVSGADCFVIESTPKDQAVKSDSGYAKRVSWIDKKSFVPVKGEAYDVDGALLKKFSASEIKEVDPKAHKFQAMNLECENVQSKHRTVLHLGKYQADVPVRNDFFTPRFLDKAW